MSAIAGSKRKDKTKYDKAKKDMLIDILFSTATPLIRNAAGNTIEVIKFLITYLVLNLTFG